MNIEIRFMPKQRHEDGERLTGVDSASVEGYTPVKFQANICCIILPCPDVVVKVQQITLLMLHGERFTQCGGN